MNICKFWSGIDAALTSDEASLLLPYHKSSSHYESCSHSNSIEYGAAALPMCSYSDALEEQSHCPIFEPEDKTAVEGLPGATSTRCLEEDEQKGYEVKRVYYSVDGQPANLEALRGANHE